MMGSSIFLLNPSHSKKSKLDEEYNKFLNEVLKNIKEEDEEKWETYSRIMEYLIHQGKVNYLSEIKYRITDNENPNQVILDILDREQDNFDYLIWVLKRKVKEYLEFE